VRRSSDNAETDVFFDPATGYVSLNSPVQAGGLFSAWVGVNSAFIATDYDHSGRGRHATQTVVANQKRLVNAGVLETRSGGRVGARCNVSGQNWSNLPSFTIAPVIAGEASYIGAACVDTDAEDAAPWSVPYVAVGSHWTFLNGAGQLIQTFLGNVRPAIFTPAVSWPLNRVSSQYMFRQANNIQTRLETTAPASYTSSSVADGTLVLTTTTVDGPSRYGSAHPTNFFGGLVFEKAIFNRLLTNAERALVQSNQLVSW